jgi:serine/threonine protein kinase
VTEPKRAPVAQMPVRAYGKYLLVRKLAEGGMAEIFLAKQVGVEGFERNVVIKRMLPHLSQVQDFVTMFLDEARLAASLAHPNIVQLSDLGHADGCYYICMEYLAGEDFAAVLRTARRRNEHVPLHIVLRIIADAGAGLHAAHEATDTAGKPTNLVHRDISPSNIFVTYSGQVKVLDFGIAKAESRVSTTTAGIVKGKYQYMSPEQARGDVVDRRSDVFSLGVSMYEALTGIKPFARDNDLAILRAVLEGSYQPIRALRPDLPLELESIVVRSMAQDPEHRYPTALAMVQDIERFLGNTTSSGGAQQLSSYMVGTFGEERVNSKVRIESLDELVKRGVDVPGRPNPLATKTDPGTETRAVRLPGRHRPLLLTAGLMVLGGAATLLALKLSKGPSSPQVDAGVPTHSIIADAGIEPDFDAGEADFDAGDPDFDAGATERAGRVTPKPISLTPAIVQRSISQNKARFQKCFVQHQADLPAKSGAVLLRFVISGNGRVTDASTDLPNGSAASACLESVVTGIVFPKNVDNGVRVPISLGYDLQ